MQRFIDLAVLCSLICTPLLLATTAAVATPPSLAEQLKAKDLEILKLQRTASGLKYIRNLESKRKYHLWDELKKCEAQTEELKTALAHTHRHTCAHKPQS